VITYLVGLPADVAHLRSLGAAAGGDNIVVEDTGGRLVALFGRDRLPVLVLVRRDGVVHQVLLGVAAGLDIDGVLARMLSTNAVSLSRTVAPGG
jgi:hypothetical protein